MTSPAKPTTLYDVLGVTAQATTEEIKKRYRALAIKHHPDKNRLEPDQEAEANARFALITEAYKVLSDDRQRRWYDAQKVERLSAAEIEESALDEVYFTSACFSGFEENKTKSFYTVYGALFERIVELEQRFNENFDYPLFGGPKRNLAEVKRFYDVWQSFSTGFTFTHLEGMFDIKSGDSNRQLLRLAKKENTKVMEKARKERNGRIRRLVALVRKTDPRMKVYQQQLEAKTAENRLKSEQNRLRQIAEAKKALDDYHHQKRKQSEQWLNTAEVEQELQELEKDDEEDSDEDGEEDDKEKEKEVYFCADCNRFFKTKNTLKNHQKSKKHLAVLRQQQKQMQKEAQDE